MGDLNGLMRALRDEIALAGEKGATVQAVLAGIDYFYQSKAKQKLSDQANISSQNIDRAFQERVWSWLAKDRLVSVGKFKEGNSLSLSELEARNLESDPLRIFTTEQQIWITLTGKEKDLRKIPPKSFELLSVIAAHREKGIAQPDVVKITGQDKRSVPTRTRKLADAGHIKKIPVLANSANTSLLIHSKFFSHLPTSDTATRTDGSINTESGTSGVWLGRNKYIRAEKEIRTAVKLLQEEENHLMLWNDIRVKCQVVDNPTISRPLAEGMRRLEELGVVARVRASTGLSKDDGSTHLYRCMQLLRDPTEEDWHNMFQLTRKEQHKLAESAPSQDICTSIQTKGIETATEADSLTIDDGPVKTAEGVILPSWNPDRLLTHTIYSALLEAGTTGLSTKDLKRLITGPFYSRPVDRFLERCTKFWQLSQPLHLRHLALVRDSAQFGKTSFYVYFVHDAFGVKVENRETFWEAIQPLPEPKQPASVDPYGFEVLPSSVFAGSRYDLTLQKALEITVDGHRSSPAHGSSSNSKTLSKKRQSQAGNNSRKPNQQIIPTLSRGRPRKFPNVNDELDISKLSPAQIQKALHSQKRAQEYLRKKAHKQVEEHVSNGMPQSQAEQIVIAELGLTPESYLRNTVSVIVGRPKGSSARKVGRPPKRKRVEISTAYLPSVLAHSFPVYGNCELGKKAPDEPSSKRQKQSTPGIGYLPSVLAHTLTVPLTWNCFENGKNHKISKSKRKSLGPKPKQIPKPVPRNGPPAKLPTKSHLATSHEKLDNPESGATNMPIADLPNVQDKSDPQGISEDPQQLNEVHEDQQNEFTIMENSTKHHDQQKHDSLASGSVTTSSLKRKASFSNLPANSSKKQRQTHVGESSNDIPWENVDNAEDTIPERTMVIVPPSFPHASSVLGDQNVAEAAVAGSRPQTPTGSQSQLATNHSSLPDVVEDNVSATDLGKSSPAQRKTQVSRSAPPFGGTIAAMRRLIILEIVKNCDGVFPGDGELVYPFTTAYVRKFPDAKPDVKTVKGARSTMVNNAQLKQIYFTYKASSGTVHTKSIITLPDILDTDERVKNLQEEIKKAHPCFYFPPGTDIRPDLMPRTTSLDTSSRIVRKATYTKNLPVISDVVISQQEVKSRDQTYKGVSNRRIAPTRSGKSRQERSKTSNSKQIQKQVDLQINQEAGRETNVDLTLEASNNGHTIGEESQHNRRFLLKRNTNKRVSDSVIEDSIPKKRQRQSKSGIETQSRSAEVDIPSTAQEQARETTLVSQSNVSVPVAPITLNTYSRSEASIDHANAAQPQQTAQTNLSLLAARHNGSTTSEMTTQHDYPAIVQAHGQYPGNPLAGTPSTIAQLGVYGIHRGSGSSVTARESVFVHYPFPTKDYTSVPIKVNPVGRKRVERVVPKAIPKQKQPKPKDRLTANTLAAEKVPRKSVVQNTGDKSPKIDGRKQRTARPKPSALELLEQKQEKTPGIRYSKSSQLQVRQAETRRERRNWEPENDRKLLIATIFSRIVCGGVREENHWSIVSAMLGHIYNRDICRRRWSSVRNKCRGDVELLTLALRSAFLESYGKDDVPKLDYTNISENDWEGLLAWAIDKIDNPVSEDIELPASREAFESTFMVQEFPPLEGPDFFETKRVASVPVRHSALNSCARLLTDEAKSPVTDLDVAKTYIVANVLTPEKAYEGEAARNKLLKFPESTFEQALTALLADKIVMQTNRGQAAPGRTYDISNFYLKNIQWKLSVAHFKYAAAFKEILDKKIDMGGSMQYKQAFGNGEMITLINLLADGMLELDGKDIPNKMFGFPTEGYQTRTMDKRVYNFGIHFKAKEDYAKGQPCAPLPLPPMQSCNQSTESTSFTLNPVWIDINGDLLPTVWDLAVAAVMTFLVINTGSDAEHIAKKLHPCVAPFEAQLIMQWLVDAGVADWKDQRKDCLCLKNGWWSVITTPIAKSANAEQATMIAGQPMQQ